MTENNPFSQESYNRDPLITKAQQRGEIFMPFQFTPEGGVRNTPSPMVAMGQHIESLICTRFGERVMRPSYGTNVYDTVLDVANEIKADELRTEITNVVRREEPSVTDLRVVVTPLANSYTIEVTFGLPPFPGTHTVTPPILPTFSEEF